MDEVGGARSGMVIQPSDYGKETCEIPYVLPFVCIYALNSDTL